MVNMPSDICRFPALTLLVWPIRGWKVAVGKRVNDVKALGIKDLTLHTRIGIRRAIFQLTAFTCFISIK